VDEHKQEFPGADDANNDSDCHDGRKGQIPSTKRIIRKEIKIAEDAFRGRDPAGDRLAFKAIGIWAGLPDACGCSHITVAAFGGLAMDLNTPGTFASGVVAMGHLRLAHPAEFPPCSNSLAEYTDTQKVFLPTIKDVSGHLFRVPFVTLRIHQDIITGVQVMAAAGVPKDQIFPVTLAYTQERVAPVGDETRSRLTRLLQVGRQVGERQWPHPAPAGVELGVVFCLGCGKPRPFKRKAVKFKKCGRCRKAFYCRKQCQEKHWPEHKLMCRAR